MKHTAKYNAAITTAQTILDKPALSKVKRDNATLYDALERKGWFWDAESGKWQDFKKSTSMFEGDDGLPTNQFRIRLMAHPDVMPKLVEVVTEALDTYGATVIETSNGYPNRRGPGLRVYMTAKLPEGPADQED